MYHESDDDVFSVEPDNSMVPLDSGDPEYLRGVEVGYMMAVAYFGFPAHMRVHVSNTEMIMRIADAYDMSFYATDSPEDSDVVVVTLTPPNDGDYEEDDDD